MPIETSKCLNSSTLPPAKGQEHSTVSQTSAPKGFAANGEPTIRSPARAGDLFIVRNYSVVVIVEGLRHMCVVQPFGYIIGKR